MELEFYVSTTCQQPVLEISVCLEFDLIAINHKNICDSENEQLTLVAMERNEIYLVLKRFARWRLAQRMNRKRSPLA